MDRHEFSPEEMDHRWAAYLAWTMNVPEPNLPALDGPLETWRNAEEPMVSAAVADYLEE
jgi:3-mercaptopyruvate sulfurtransferase SseA